jgi:hypothetical protein
MLDLVDGWQCMAGEGLTLGVGPVAWVAPWEIRGETTATGTKGRALDVPVVGKE